ncbi:MAG: hypothetical protein O3A25_09110 [Acidobacteria bacterium]|nr:hypothetical protein [Acidobacteriota bacterium]
MTFASSDRRALAVLGLVGSAVGAAAWLVPASHHIVSSRGGVPGRVVLIASPWWLAVTIAVGVVSCAGCAWWWWIGDRPLRTAAYLAAPLLLLWLWVVPYLPWVPGQVPLLLLLAGPLRWLVLALALLGCVVNAIQSGVLARPKPSWSWPGRRLVFAASLILFLGGGQYVKQTQGFGGDEPHYLVLAHSLLADQDLRIENNHDNRDYWAFHSAELPMHYLARGRDAVVYSIHGAGLPALLLPAYAVAGHWGALALVGLLAALAALAIFDLAATIAPPPMALATWAAVALTVPFGLQSWLIFPEMPAALLMAWAALWVWRDPPARVGVWVGRGAALSLLPWLHMKFSLLLFVVGLWLAYRLLPRWRLVVALLAPIGVSGVAWLGSFYVMYGDWNPTVAYGYSQGAELDWLNVPRGLLGLSFDQEYGLLPYSPIFAAALVGAWVMARRRDMRGHLVGILLVIGPFLASTTNYYMWWGGGSVPARFVVPILPLVAPLIAVAFRECRSPAARGVLGASLAYSLVAFVTVVARPAAMLMYNDRDGTGRLVETVQAGVPLTATLPSFIDPDIVVQLPMAGIWVVAAISAALATRWVSRRVEASTYLSAVLAALLFGGAGSVLAAATLSDPVPQGTVHSGRQRLLEMYPGERLRGFSYESGGWWGAWLTDAELMARTTLEPDVDGESSDPSRLTQPFALPAGRYDLLVWFSEQQVIDGHVFLSYDRTAGILARANGRATNPAVVPLDLPVALGALRIGATSAALARTVTRVALAPRALAPRARPGDVGRVLAVKPVGERVGAYVLFMDLNTFVEPENNWVQGGHVSELRVSPADATTMRIRIRNGAADNRIEVRAGQQSETLTLAAWETSELVIDVPVGEERPTLIPVFVAPERGFVPAEADPGSTDRRVLGCTVTVELDS